jgi:hypothetical protein
VHQVEDVEDVVVDPAERESNEPTLIIHDSKLIIDTMVFEIKVARGKTTGTHKDIFRADRGRGRAELFTVLNTVHLQQLPFIS